jgi:hypothetical protein
MAWPTDKAKAQERSRVTEVGRRHLRQRPRECSIAFPEPGLMLVAQKGDGLKTERTKLAFRFLYADRRTSEELLSGAVRTMTALYLGQRA